MHSESITVLTMKKVITLLAVIFASGMACYGALNSGNGLLKGRIFDNENNPLPGAVVILDDNSSYAVTDVDGY